MNYDGSLVPVLSFKVMSADVARRPTLRTRMKAPLPPTSPAVPIMICRLLLFPASSDAATTHAGPGSPIGMATLQPVIRLLTGMLLLCWVASASADLVPSPGQLSFPDQTVFTTSPPMATTLGNTGNQSLTVVSVTPASGVYARAGGSCGATPFTIVAQASCTLEHTFTPTSINSFYQTLTVTLDGGVDVNFGLAGDGNVGHLDVSPTSLDWLPTPVGTFSAEKTVSLQNDRPVPLEITAIDTSSVPAVSAFVRTGGNCPPPPIQFSGYQGCLISYTFVPAQVGESTMDVNFHSSAGGGYSLYLRGEGSPEIPIFEDGFDQSGPAPIQ